MQIGTSLYEILQNRIIQAAIPELGVLAGSPELYMTTDKNPQLVEMQILPPIICERGECLIFKDPEEIRRPDGTMPEELGYCY